MATTYPAGTPLIEIDSFDRSTKVAFECTKHPEVGVWRSKDPRVSNCFPSAEGQTEMCSCAMDQLVTAAEYTS